MFITFASLIAIIVVTAVAAIAMENAIQDRIRNKDLTWMQFFRRHMEHHAAMKKIKQEQGTESPINPIIFK